MTLRPAFFSLLSGLGQQMINEFLQECQIKFIFALFLFLKDEFVGVSLDLNVLQPGGETNVSEVGIFHLVFFKIPDYVPVPILLTAGAAPWLVFERAS